jgi:hypothetical protein
MKNNQIENEYDSFRRKIADLDALDFNGHTCFKDLTPEQRLDWLAELVVFVHECRVMKTKSDSLELID